ncbi:hypothetical protein [Klebsiella pneumoniae IS22]|nr:hypothetical protein [Klebsiella pneumoniae IS22]
MTETVHASPETIRQKGETKTASLACGKRLRSPHCQHTLDNNRS